MKYLLLFFFFGLLGTADAQWKGTEPVSPPQLVLPADSERVELPRPLFTWLPPAPSNLFPNLMYDWILVDIAGTQSASDAIQQNIPVFTRQNISFTSFQYPLSAPALDSTKLYAWRVTAKSNMSPIANSEVWTFRLATPAPPAKLPVREGSYVKVKKEEGAAMAIVSGVVRYEYFNEINDSVVAYTISDITTSARKQLFTQPVIQQVHFGQNLLQIDVSKNNLMIHRHFYMLQITNSKKEKWYLKFEYRKPE